MTMRALISTIAIAATTGSAWASESVVTVPTPGGDMVATLMLPDGDPAPVVLLLHGFTGARDELATEHVPEGVFARTAAQLAEAGYASLRVDFRGSGESTDELDFADTTFEGQVADGLAALDYLDALETVAGEDVFVIGWSQGGLVAGAVAGRSGKPDAVALWNAVADPVATYGNLLGADVIAAGAEGPEDEVHSLALPWGAEIELKGAFFDQVMSFDPDAEIMGYTGPLLVVQGANDTTVLPTSADLWLAGHGGDGELWTAEMDHVFNVFGEAETLTRMIEATIEFFERNAD